MSHSAEKTAANGWIYVDRWGIASDIIMSIDADCDLVYVGKEGQELLNNTLPQSVLSVNKEPLACGIFADYLEDKVESSESRDRCINFYRAKLTG